MANQNIQLTTTNELGQEVKVYPNCKPEFVFFEDNKTLLDKLKNIAGNGHTHDKVTYEKDGLMSKEDKFKFDNYTGPIELQVTDTHIQWKRLGTNTWYDLIAISELIPSIAHLEEKINVNISNEEIDTIISNALK